MQLPSPHIILRADHDLTIIEQNPAHAKVSLTKRADTIGKPLLVAFPDDSEKFKKTGVSDLVESFRRVIKTGKPDRLPSMKYDLKDKSGAFLERWWRVTHYPIFADDGSVEAVHQITEDITHEIKTQQQLDSTTSQLQSALSVGLVSAWAWDIKNDVVRGDANLAKSFGVSYKAAQQGLPLQAFLDSIHSDDAQRVAAAIGQAVSENITYEQEFRTINAKKQVRWVIARGEVVNDDNGVPINFRGILIDITDRKTAEAKLEDSQAMFKALFDSTILAIAMVDLSGNILQANKTFLKLFGYSAKDLASGINSAQLSAPGSAATTRRIYESLQRTGEADPTEKKYLRRDGNEFSALVGAAMLPDNKDRFMAFILDMSETEKLKAMNDAKDEFIALASHQLRSPASVVKQYLGVLIDGIAGPVSQDQLEYLTTANNANDRQLNIINDLLKTAQLDTQGYALSLLPKNLVKITQRIIDECESLVAAKRQRIIYQTSSDNAITRIDETEMAICISNLIENASKYSPCDTTITVTIKQTSSHVELRVADQGVGIRPEDCERIFDKFTRIDNVLSDTTSGSGLGLYWVKRIIDMHRGSLKVTSKLGKGTTFSVRLPV